MKIYFVRHGHPSYELDRLTELGHKQAAAAAKRLYGCGIQHIYASTHGRAMETAQHTADLLGLDISPCPFMREIFWGPTGQESIFEGGHPWFVSWAHVAEGLSLLDRDWLKGSLLQKSDRCLR